MPSMMELSDELGCAAMTRGDFKEARKHFRYMVKESQKYGAKEQALAMNRLGTVCVRDKRFKEAEDAFRSCLELSERAHGAANPEVCSALNNLAFTLWKGLKNKPEAKAFLERAVQTVVDALPFAPDISTVQVDNYIESFDTLSLMHEEERDFVSAENDLRQALKIKVDAVGASSPTVFRTLMQLSEFLSRRGRKSEANQLLDEYMPALKKFSDTIDDTRLKSMISVLETGTPAEQAEALKSVGGLHGPIADAKD